MRRCSKIKELFLTYVKDIKSDLKSINKKNIGILIKKRYKLFLTIIVFIVVFALSISIFSRTSLQQVLVQLEEGLVSGNIDDVAKYIRVNNNKVSKEDLKPLVNLYKGESENVNSIIKDLEMYGKSDNFSWVVTNKLFQKDSYINIDKVELGIYLQNEEEIDLNNMIVKLNGKEILDINKKINVIPGKHNIQYIYTTKFGDVIDSYEVDVSRDIDTEIEVPIRYITLYTDFEDATVYINGKAVDEKAGEIKQYGPLPKKDFQFYIEKEFPWGLIKSQVETLSDNDYLNININMANEDLMSEIEDNVNTFYSSVFQGLNKQGKDKILNCTENVKDKIYNYMNKEYFIIKNDYEISKLDVNIERSEFKNDDGKYSANIVTKLDYSIDKKWIPFTKQQYDKYFLLIMYFDESQWIIEDVQEFDIENLD